MFPNSFIQELKDKNDIVDVVSGYVDLKKKGGKFWGCCPFHQEKTASFNVDVNGQFFYCFGCHTGGDVITFVQQTEHLTKFEAIEFLANRANIQLPSKVDSDEEQRKQEEKKRHYQMHKKAARFYVDRLLQDKGAAKAYLKKRGISSELVKLFGIGFAPDAKEELRKLLTKDGFTDKQMLDSNLIKQGSYGLMDSFRNRLMFPIIDIFGNVIGFGGRVLDDSLPKYLNSAESRFYNKRRHLFGLNLVKNQKPLTHIVLVEGYMDVVMLTGFGVNGVVASLGTALTSQQANLIKRFAPDVFICYDGDAAGQKAALRASGILQEAGLNVRVIDLPGGQDPDDFIKSQGLTAFEQMMEKALLPHQYEVERLAERYQLSEENQRRDFALAALKIVARLKNNLDKEDMIKYLEVKTGYTPQVLNIEQLSLQKKEEKQQQPARKKPPEPKQESAAEKAEQLLLKLALNGYRDQLLDELTEDEFSDVFHKQIFAMLQEAPLTEGELQAMVEDQADAAKLVLIRMSPMGGELDKAFEDCRRIIRRQQHSKELQKLLDQLQQPGLSEQEKTKILEQVNHMQTKLKEK